jgi:probable biosynthetic protein (TIGR04098 family)
MIIEKVDLTMSHLGLGPLNEYALMVLFANGHSHHLTLGTGITPDQIKDSQELVLYPAYFMTHLTVPPHSLLTTYRLWDRVEVGVDVHRFGETLLESTYILGKEGQIPNDVEQWQLQQLPSMRANNLIVVDASVEGSPHRRVSVPQEGCMAKLPRVTRPPAAIAKANNVRSNGFDMPASFGRLNTTDPISYQVASGRDAADGHTMIFAKFSEIMDYAEANLLSRRLRPGFPAEVLRHLAVVEREIFYYGNCFAGESLEIHLRGDIQACPADYHGESLEIISTAILTFIIEIYQHKDNALLAMAKVKKLLAIPMRSQVLVQDVKRLIAVYSSNNQN